MGRIVYVSREFGPSVRGGIGNRTLAQAATAAARHEVVVIAVDSESDGAAERLAEAAPGARLVALPDVPYSASPGYFGHHHRWSHIVYRALAEEIERHGPVDMVEFPDYRGEGAVTIQARRTGDPLLAGTTVCVRLCGSDEMHRTINRTAGDDPELDTLYRLERYALRFADRLTLADEAVADAYEMFYGAEALAPREIVPHVSMIEPRAIEPRAAGPADPLKILYLGRLERRKGVFELVAALAGAAFDGWTLTLAGRDTPTGALHTSVLAGIEEIAGLDPRIELIGEQTHAQSQELIREHDTVIMPSLWECHPNVGVEALANNRPLLATPVGGLRSLAVERESGMLARGNSAADVAALVRRAADAREELRALSARGAPAAHCARHCSREDFAAAVDRLAGLADPAPSGRRPLVSAVIPHFHTAGQIRESVESIAAQTYPEIELLIIDDGSLAPDDVVLEGLATEFGARVITQTNRGVSAARNLGARHTEGEYLLFFDADNRLDPRFVERAVELLEREPATAYVTGWVDFIDSAGRPLDNPPYRPVSNACATADAVPNWAGDAYMVVRRSAYERAGGFGDRDLLNEDAQFYSRLALLGEIGHAMPEYANHYRLHAENASRPRDAARPLLTENMLSLRREDVFLLPPSGSSEAQRTSDRKAELELLNRRLAALLEQGEAREHAEGDEQTAADTRLAELRSRRHAQEARKRELIGELDQIHHSRGWFAHAPVRAAERLLGRRDRAAS